ncbi:MAG: PAS domain-containing protein, partial [Gammaproteobacteria bacterium]
MDNAMIPSLLLVLSILLVGVLALLVLLIIRARQSGLLTSASGVGQPPAENAEKAPEIDFQTAFFRVFDEHPSPQVIHRDFVIERVNAAFVAELGYAPEEVIGRPVIYLMDERSSSFLFDQVETQRQKTFEDHELPPERIVRARMKGDTYAPFATQPNRVSPDGRTICLTIHRLTDQEE